MLMPHHSIITSSKWKQALRPQYSRNICVIQHYSYTNTTITSAVEICFVVIYKAIRNSCLGVSGNLPPLKVPGEFLGNSTNCRYSESSYKNSAISTYIINRSGQNWPCLDWESGSKSICSCRTCMWLTISELAESMQLTSCVRNHAGPWSNSYQLFEHNPQTVCLHCYSVFG